MKLGKLTLDWIGKILVPFVWEEAKSSVNIAQLTGDMTGEEKKKFAINRLQELGFKFSKLAFNFIIELACIWLATKLGQDPFKQKDENL